MTLSLEQVQAFREFLTHYRFPKASLCPDCKKPMEFMQCTFLFDDSHWRIQLPFCRECSGFSNKSSPSLDN